MSDQNLRRQDLQAFDVAPLQNQDWNPVQRFFIQRLWRLLNMQKQFDDEISPEGVSMIRRAIYSTFQDCVTSGVSDEASRLIREMTDDEAGVPEGRRS